MLSSLSVFLKDSSVLWRSSQQPALINTPLLVASKFTQNGYDDKTEGTYLEEMMVSKVGEWSHVNITVKLMEEDPDWPSERSRKPARS